MRISHGELLSTQLVQLLESGDERLLGGVGCGVGMSQDAVGDGEGHVW